jgi:hypothetical protein
VFRTESEYTDFKEALANPQVTSWDATVLSSEPPILIQFTAKAQANYNLAYGQGHYVHWFGAGIEPYSLGGLFMLVFGSMFFTLFITRTII